MTQKELAYLEDAIGHEQNIIAIIQDGIKNMSDKRLITFLESEVDKHTETKSKLMHMLEVKSNE